MFGDIANQSRDTVDPYTGYAYYYFLGKECEKLRKDYDCGCYTALRCEIEKRKLKRECLKLMGDRARKDLLDELLP